MNIGDQVRKNGPDHKPVGPVLTITDIRDKRTYGMAGDIKAILSDNSSDYPWNLTWLTQEKEIMEND